MDMATVTVPPKANTSVHDKRPDLDNSFQISNNQIGKEASVSTIGGLVLVVLIIVLVVCKRRCNGNNKSEDHGSVGSDSFASSNQKEAYPELLEILCKLESRNKLEFPRFWFDVDDKLRQKMGDVLVDHRRLQTQHIIGYGQFGCVYEATLAKDTRSSNDYGPLTHDRVAVKTLKGDNLDSQTVEAFLKEGMIMKDFKHVNVLTLLGVSIGEEGVPTIILPYMAKGNLKKYISNPRLAITIRELLGLGTQVAEGMQYLAEQKFVHRDLAARNCMLDSKMIVKVADFGLSRDIYSKEYYTSDDKQAKLPIKWMALESLTKSVYTTRTDVWSFGVLLWELLTRGATPYPDVSNWEIRDYLLSGRRMHPPEMCPSAIFELMLSCWSVDPDDRPTFRNLADKINATLKVNAFRREPDYANLSSMISAPRYTDIDTTGSTITSFC